ncbi:MAG TPA: pyridoxal-phosphate dependent enzyme, partial [Actinomycetota bacterium]
MGAIARLRDSGAWRDVFEGEAGRRVGALTRQTPVVRAPGMLVKAEGLQRTGSYKARGAIAKLATIPAGGEVVTASAGNHGLGVAYASAALGHRATVVVSEAAPEVKRRGIEGLGARLVVHGAGYDDAEAYARSLAEGEAALFVGYADDHVIVGNGGTIAQELLEQVEGLGEGDAVVIPVGGGGLASGIGAALAGSGVGLVGVEPETNRAMSISFDEGAARTSYPEGASTLAEGLEGAVAENTYELCRESLDEIVLVGEEEIRRAIARAYTEMGLVLEASAAVAPAAV